MTRCAVLVSGRGSNLGALLDAHKRGELPVEFVLVAGDNPSAPALARASAEGIQTWALAPREAGGTEAFFARLAEQLSLARADLVVLAGFMRILPAWLVERYPNRIINIHPSLLPAFPGLHAQRQALAYGAKVSGCTVHFVDVGVDTGPIIAQTAVPVEPDDDEETLAARILREEHKLLPECVRLFAAGRLKVTGRMVSVLPAGEPAPSH